MDQQDQVNQEIMDVDPIMLESIDEIEAFLELGESIESNLTNYADLSDYMISNQRKTFDEMANPEYITQHVVKNIIN